MSSKRSAADAIMAIEEKINRITGLVQNTDNNLKILLHRVNKMSNEFDQLRDEMASQPKMFGPGAATIGVHIPKNIHRDVTPEDLNKAENNLFGVHEQISFSNSPLEDETVPKGQRRGLRAPGDPNSPKVSVSQQVLYSDNSPMYLAHVEIFTLNGTLVKKIRTNANGKWAAPLNPGEYSIRVFKRLDDGAIKKPVEFTYEIEIPSSKEKIMLESLIAAP